MCVVYRWCNPVEPSPPDLSPIGEGSADGVVLKRTCLLIRRGGIGFTYPFWGIRWLVLELLPKPTRQGRPSPCKIFNLGFEEDDLVKILLVLNGSKISENDEF